MFLDLNTFPQSWQSNPRKSFSWISRIWTFKYLSLLNLFPQRWQAKSATKVTDSFCDICSCGHASFRSSWILCHKMCKHGHKLILDCGDRLCELSGLFYTSKLCYNRDKQRLLQLHILKIQEYSLLKLWWFLSMVETLVVCKTAHTFVIFSTFGTNMLEGSVINWKDSYC